MISLRPHFTLTIDASWQLIHFLGERGSNVSIKFGNERHEDMLGKDGKEYIDLYGQL